MPIFGKKADDPETPKELPSVSPHIAPIPLASEPADGKDNKNNIIKTFKELAYKALLARIDIIAANKLTPDQLREEIEQFVFDLSAEKRLQINLKEQKLLASSLVDDMIGLGPLEGVLHDESVTDVLVNGPFSVYVERKGKLVKDSTQFEDEAHLQRVARRIASRIGRRVDESSPMVDARLEDGSRVNIIMPPLALDGTAISIRKFSKNEITIDKMVKTANLSGKMADYLKIAATIRLNTLISGGTGSGKTTLLNAMSQLINHTERIVTIEDAAELRLQQPHVVRLESRPANIEGQGEISIRSLVKNALRMRPDRIIVGEVRGDETIDMLQAMNTGHDGSMSTIHANRAREVLTRLETMMLMSGYEMPSRVLRSQIVGAVHLIVHTERMRDGVRRVVEITELTGMEEDMITMRTLFQFEFRESTPGKGIEHAGGVFQCKGLMSHFAPRAQFYGLEGALREALEEGT